MTKTTKTDFLAFVDIETVPSQDPSVLADIEAKFPMPVLDLDGIKADGRLKDETKIEADIAAKRERAVTEHGEALDKRLANIDEAYRKTALDGASGHLASVAWATDDNVVVGKSNPACDLIDSAYDDEAGKDIDLRGQGVTLFTHGIDAEYRLNDVLMGEREILQVLFDDLTEIVEAEARAAAAAYVDASMANNYEFLKGREATIEESWPNLVQPPVLVAHFADFDIRFIWQRAIALGVPVPAWWPVNASKYSSDRVQDTMVMWAGHGSRIGLDRLCRALGVAGKTDMDGSMVWDAVREGRIAEVVEYNRGDVRRLRSVHRRMRGLEVLLIDVDPAAELARQDRRPSTWEQIDTNLLRLGLRVWMHLERQRGRVDHLPSGTAAGGSMTDFSESIAVTKQLQANIVTWRRQATFACAVSPLHWMAVHGVSLHDYLAQLEALDKQCVDALARMQQPEGAA